MVWSRAWLLGIATALAVAVAIVLTVSDVVQPELEREVALKLRRAHHSATLLLKLNARQWIDSAAVLSGDAVLVESLDQATRGQGDPQLVHKTVQERLSFFDQNAKLGLSIATDARGRVIARAGVDESWQQDFLDGFPLVSDALRGIRGDDVWALRGKLYRLAASPVIAATRDRYVGALIIGQEIGTELAQSMRQVLDVDVVFLLKGQVLASSSPLAELQELPASLATAKPTASERETTEPSPPVESAVGRLLVIASPLVGEAAGLDASYALAALRPVPLQPVELVRRAVEVWRRDPRRLAIPGGLLAGIILIAFVLIRLEHSRPIARLARETIALARGELQRLDDEQHPGLLGGAARAVNATLDRATTASRLRRSTGSVPQARTGSDDSAPEPTTSLGPTRSPAGAVPSEEGLALAGVEAGYGAPPGPVPYPAGPPPDSEPVDGPSASLFDDSPTRDDLLGPPGPGTGPARNLGELAGPADYDARDFIGSAGLGAALAGGPFEHQPTTRVPAQFDGEQTLAVEGFPGIPGITAQGAATVVPGRDHSAPTIVSGADPREADYPRVFEDFLQKKQICGESVEGVTYDKFAAKLRSNREQLVQRMGCKDVKFSVYINKDGKAALKATPIT